MKIQNPVVVVFILFFLGLSLPCLALNSNFEIETSYELLSIDHSNNSGLLMYEIKASAEEQDENLEYKWDVSTNSSPGEFTKAAFHISKTERYAGSAIGVPTVYRTYKLTVRDPESGEVSETSSEIIAFRPENLPIVIINQTPRSFFNRPNIFIDMETNYSDDDDVIHEWIINRDEQNPIKSQRLDNYETLVHTKISAKLTFPDGTTVISSVFVEPEAPSFKVLDVETTNDNGFISYEFSMENKDAFAILDKNAPRLGFAAPQKGYRSFTLGLNKIKKLRKDQEFFSKKFRVSKQKLKSYFDSEEYYATVMTLRITNLENGYSKAVPVFIPINGVVTTTTSPDTSL